MKLSINTAKTLENFGQVFSDKFKVISELIQNSRRAGATAVQISEELYEGAPAIVVSDDGHGIENFDTLFCLSESGWSDDIQAEQQPFGMGFFSTLYACETVIVESNGQRITIDCKKAIQLDDFGSIAQGCSTMAGTRITLVGVDLPSLKARLQRAAEYSSIDLFYNGEVLPSKSRFSALSQKYPVIDTPYGKLIITRMFNCGVEVVVQDICVQSDRTYSYSPNVLFADSAAVKVRMPDRDSIIDRDAFNADFRKWLCEYYKDLLNTLRRSMNDDAAFLNAFFADVLRFDKQLTCEIPYLPAQALLRVSLPETQSINGSMPLCAERGVHRHDDIAVVASDILVSDGASPMIAAFAHYSGALFPVDDLPREHWIFTNVVDFDIRDFQVLAVKPVTFGFDSLNMICNGTAIGCDNIVITHLPSGKSVTAVEDIDDNKKVIRFCGIANASDELLAEHRDLNVIDESGRGIDVTQVDMLLIKTANYFSDVLVQVTSYQGEFDVRERELDEDSDTLAQQVKVACHDSFNDVLSEMMGLLPRSVANRLDGKTATVKFENGRAIFSVAA